MKIRIEAAASFLFCALCAVLALALFVRYLLPIVLPFAIAYLCALATRGLAEKLHRKTGMPTPFLRVLLLIFVILLLFALCFWLGFCLVNEAQTLLLRWGSGSSGAENALASLRDSLHGLAEHIGGGALEGTVDSLLREGTSLALSLLSGVVGNALRFVPRALIFLLITLIAALYFALDLHRVSAFCASLVPDAYRKTAARTVSLFKNCLLRYVRAYALLAVLTFCMLLFGFLCIGIRYAFLTAALLTLLDLLPVLGVGFVLVPWGILSIAAGAGARGFALLLLFALMFIARQILEPKIVGAQMGLHPLVSLFFSYAGLRLFGVAGMIFAPIAASLARELFDGAGKRSE